MNLLGFTCLKETFAENTGRLAMKTSSYLGFNQSQSLPTPLFRSTHLQTMQTLENGPCAWRSLKKSSDDHIPRPPSNCDVPFLNSNVCLVTSRNRVSLLFASRVHIYIYICSSNHIEPQPPRMPRTVNLPPLVPRLARPGTVEACGARASWSGASHPEVPALGRLGASGTTCWGSRSCGASSYVRS